MPFFKASSSAMPISAAYFRTSSVIFMLQKCGPHIEQKCAVFAPYLREGFVVEFAHVGNRAKDQAVNRLEQRGFAGTVVIQQAGDRSIVERKVHCVQNLLPREAERELCRSEHS